MQSSFIPRAMPYTLWSRGRLVGHTEFEFVANTDEHKMGWFHPTEVGLGILEIMTEPSRVVCSIRHGVDVEGIRVDLDAATDRIAALDLELRSPEGTVLAVEDIGINDTERLMQLARDTEDDQELDDLDELDELSDELKADIAHDLEILRFDDFEADEDQPWEETKFPRYQILAFF